MAKTVSGREVTQLRRDPYTRATLYRDTLPAEGRRISCRWCGKKHAKYLYAWADDSVHGRVYFDRNRPFCSVSCWEAYGT